MIPLMCRIEKKAKNKQAKFRDNRRVVIRGGKRWGEDEKNKEGQTYGDGGKLDIGW